MMAHRSIRAWGVLAVIALAGSAANAFVSWAQPNGSASNFSWANGGSENGLFGDPTVLGNSFLFFPSNFIAVSNNGGTTTTDDTLEFDLIAGAGFEFTMIRIREVGMYAIQGQGEANVSGLLTISDLLGLKPDVQAPLETFPDFPVNDGSGSWEGLVNADLGLVQGSWTQIHIAVHNELVAISNGMGDSVIVSKNFLDTGLAIDVIPAPGAGALLGIGCVVAARRRR